MSEDDEEAMTRLTRRALLTGALVAGAAAAGWAWLRTRPRDMGQPWPLRRMLNANEALTRRLYAANHRAATYAGPADARPRVNGDLGLAPRAPHTHVRVDGVASRHGAVLVAIDRLQRLPRTDLVAGLRCIEGWADRGRWAGVRFADFMAAFPPQTRSGRPADLRRLDDLPPYVGLETPDRGYYVGLDMASMLHPQTILCDAMGDRPLTEPHGAPLRLYIPVKYGIKHLKRIGRIFYAFERPPDYWAERGYDWYAGL